jgi:tetratricopeptide (TPR) repeat protein
MHSSVMLERAKLLLSQGRTNDAIKEIKNLLQHEPENDSALSIYARCLYDKKEFDKGIEIVLSAIRIDPENSYYFYLLGFGYYRKDMNDAAIDNLNKAIAMSPQRAEYYGLLSLVYVDERKFETALLKADEGLALDAENITCLNARSTALNKLKRTDDAIETMQNTLAKDPENYFTHITIGWNLLEKGKHKEAINHFREALRIDPENENARTGLKQSLKSKIPPYKWMLQYSFWLNNKGKKAQRIFPIALLIGVRIIVSALASNSTTEIIGISIIGLYLLFVITSWIINPIANFFLLFHKDGKYALNETEKYTAIGSVSSITIGLIFCGLSFLFRTNKMFDSFLIAAVACFALSVPLGQLKYPLSWKKYGNSNKACIVLASLGIITFLFAFLYVPAAMVTGVLFAVLFVLRNWMSVFR